MTAPSRGRDDATIRGAVVLVVAIVIGLALLWRSGAGDDESASAGRETTTTVFQGDASTDSDGSTMPTISSTTTATGTGDTQPPEAVAVIVLNGTPDRVAGIAREFTDKAAAAGYQTLDPADAAASTDTTTIYAADGFELDAEAMREVLELDAIDPIVAAMPDESLGAGSDTANIVVVLGSDYAS